MDETSEDSCDFNSITVEIGNYSNIFPLLDSLNFPSSFEESLIMQIKPDKIN
jgi:hypothetical protein